jgi:hypothetical protein
MSLLIDTRTGPVYQADGAGDAPIRQSRFGSLVVTDAHGRYFESVSRGNVFTATNQAAQAVSVALATTYTGLCVSNPIGNTKNALLLGCFYALTVAPAAIASLHVIGGYSATANVTHTTPLAAPGIQNSLLGTGPPSTMKADTAATIVNPGYVLPISSGFTAAALPSTTPLWIDLGGIIILPPGAWVAIGALTAVTGFGGFAWEEYAP